MGFYGNITNTARTQFQFDMIFPSRYEMDRGATTDGIYAGRYVLIEYDSDIHLDTMKRVQINSNGVAYYNPTGGTSLNTMILPSMVENGEMVYSADTSLPTEGLHMKNCKFYQYNGETTIVNGQIAAKFMEVADGANAPAYTINYNRDTKYYGQGRGYDSTVWQKVYSQDTDTSLGKETYVMLAELNTVVPTFEVSPDAPTMNPVTPHFDIASTDVYYKLHWQAPWGFRVKEAPVSQSNDQTTWTTYNYDETNNTHTKNTVTKNAAIYYNEEAFDPQLHQENIVKHSEVITENEIKVEPTGISGNRYNAHDGNLTSMSTQPDIQELTINLPAIGNMMSDVWDIVHGPNRDNDMRQTDENGNNVSSLQGRLDSIDALKPNMIPIKLSSNGQIVGTTINGGSNKEVPAEGILNEQLTNSFEQDDAWIYTKVDDNNAPNAIAIHHTFHAKKDTTSTSDVNNNGDTIDLYTPKVDAAGHVVGKNTETVTLPFGFKFIKTNGNNIAVTNPAINTNIIEADNTQDSVDINTANKWIRIANNDNTMTIGHEVHDINVIDKNQTDLNDGTDTITIQDTIYDEAGHLTANQKHTYVLPFSYKTFKTNGRNDDEITNNQNEVEVTQTVADNTQDIINIDSGNYWTRVDITNDNIKLSHSVRDIDTESNGTSNLNLENNAINENNINIPDWSYDAAGHIRSKNNHYYTLPFGFKTITTNGNSDIVTNPIVNTNSIVADTTQDSFAINTANKWIRIANYVNEDIIDIGHEVHFIEQADKEKTDLNNGTDTITIQDTLYDEAGHVTANQKHTYTLPFSFKTIKTNGRSVDESENAIGTPAVVDIIADNTQDILTINSGNKWIRIDTNGDNDSLTISHDIHNTTSTTSAQSLSDEEKVTTFEVPTYAFDRAGHYTSHDTKTITMPFGYGKIKGDNGFTAATATFDEMTFASDEWLTATITKDTITYNHDYPMKKDDSISVSDINGAGDTLVLETLERDTKGHIVKVNHNTVTLPYGYKTFIGDTGVSIANNTQDTMSVTGDSWISSIISDGAISLSHKDSPKDNPVVIKDNVTPAFGETFNVDDHYFDSKGHQFESRTHTVKIPQLSLTNGTGNIVTGLTLTPASGAFVETKSNLGAITLGTFEASDNSEDITENISLQNALRRLQNKIANTNNKIENLIGGKELNEAFNTLQEVSDWLEANDANADQIIDSIAILTADEDTDGSVKKQLKDAITTLTVEDAPVEGQYVSAINQENGIIKIERLNLPTYILNTGDTNGTVKFNNEEIVVAGLGTAAYVDKDNFAPSTILEEATFAYSADELDSNFTRLTIADLFTVVAQLNNQVQTLQQEIEKLKTQTDENKI